MNQRTLLPGYEYLATPYIPTFYKSPIRMVEKVASHKLMGRWCEAAIKPAFASIEVKRHLKTNKSELLELVMLDTHTHVKIPHVQMFLDY